MKSDADGDLVSAVEALTTGRTFFTVRAADILLNGFSNRHSVPSAQFHLRKQDHAP